MAGRKCVCPQKGEMLCGDIKRKQIGCRCEWFAASIVHQKCAGHLLVEVGCGHLLLFSFSSWTYTDCSLSSFRRNPLADLCRYRKRIFQRLIERCGYRCVRFCNCARPAWWGRLQDLEDRCWGDSRRLLEWAAQKPLFRSLDRIGPHKAVVCATRPLCHHICKHPPVVHHHLDIDGSEAITTNKGQVEHWGVGYGDKGPIDKAFTEGT